MADAQTAMTQLKEAYGASIVEMTPINGTPRLRVKKDDVPQVAHYLHTHPNLRGALSLLWAVDHRPRETRYELCYLFTLSERKDWLLLCTDLQGDERLFPSITPHIHAAKWYEREIRDMFGLIPVGHPDMRRLVRHEHWPKGSHPLKKDFRWDTVLERVKGQHAFRRIEGEGVFEVPVGPIHAGIIEPGHFRFSVAGEPIMQLEIHHFWKHRGVEKLFERQNSRKLFHSPSGCPAIRRSAIVSHTARLSNRCCTWRFHAVDDIYGACFSSWSDSTTISATWARSVTIRRTPCPMPIVAG